jgi:hypothetical protein
MCEVTEPFSFFMCLHVCNLFTGFWAFLYFVGFCYLANQWSNAETPEGGFGVNNLQAAIAFSFFSVFTWVCSKILSQKW